MMRVGLYRPVHVKTLRSQKLRMLLTHRKLLQAKAIAVENDLRATLRNFGLKVGLARRIARDDEEGNRLPSRGPFQAADWNLREASELFPSRLALQQGAG